ncbi:uncharacterized protein EV420DRAFT_1485141 [Desarmillaria tabescens]|uniref:Uncharacterized protein n=1 Tax=Armillaria tabescens TaxID=1929756 RepID=A0AA39JKJ7_ARMTA|nr:uncharacterized protein EV420DRAFT_1485141 [Desarmillaria tabescens]KAK0443034.1 hypothetical protein EV420DRAFT_1485141 [Desarmillaria tabescens]
MYTSSIRESGISPSPTELDSSFRSSQMLMAWISHARSSQNVGSAAKTEIEQMVMTHSDGQHSMGDSTLSAIRPFLRLSGKFGDIAGAEAEAQSLESMAVDSHICVASLLIWYMVQIQMQGEAVLQGRDRWGHVGESVSLEELEVLLIVPKGPCYYQWVLGHRVVMGAGLGSGT